jgi:VIT1/CCC1 family predicted Fe2+/Mn2+ transporter
MQTESFHRIHHVGWLRAAVLGANDGIVSTASLVVGVAAAAADRSGVLIAGVAGLVAGAMSMAAGEYVSVSSQADTEKADLQREKEELENNHEFEIRELSHIYQKRGLDQELARQVAVQLMEHDALAAHARDELGISENTSARPLQAALASAGTFTLGAVLPLLAVVAAPEARIALSVSLASLLALAVLGILSARVGGAPTWIASSRIVFWGALAMALTAAVGRWFGAVL